MLVKGATGLNLVTANSLNKMDGLLVYFSVYPNSKVHESDMGPILGRQDPGGPHVGPMNFAIWVGTSDSHHTNIFS